MDEEDVEELDLTESKNPVDSSYRTAIMRELLNELFLINEFEQNHFQHHPFSTLEVILEEVTPSPSQQQLQDNISAIKTGILSHSEYLDSDSDTYNISADRNTDKNMYSINKRQESSSDQSTVSGITTERTFNDSNTSNIDVQNSDQCKEKKRKTTDQDDETSLDSMSDKQKLYQKYEQFINDDTKYIQRDTPKRSPFLTLNKKYERDRAKQTKQKKINREKTEQKSKQILRNNSFHCLNTYSIKSPRSKLDYDKCTIEELEDRVQYFEKQIIDLQKEFKLEKNIKSSSSDEDSIQDRCKTIQMHRSLDRGDYNLNLDREKSKEESPTSIVSESFSNKSTNRTVILSSPRRQQNSTIIVVGNDKIQHLKKPSHNQATQVFPPRNNTKMLSENKEQFPKIMYASTAKNVSTQVNDTDWKKICYVKKEMSECGSLRISLPNSTEEDSDGLRTRRKVDFDSVSTVVHYRSVSERNSSTTTTNDNEYVNFVNISQRRRKKSNKFLGCLSCFRRIFRK